MPFAFKPSAMVRNFAGSPRYHLGLVVPKSPGHCRIFIDGEPYSWRDGEDLLFDETYLHYAENTTSDDRLILFCDVERPLTSKAMTAVNRWILDPHRQRERNAKRGRRARRPDQPHLQLCLSRPAFRQAHQSLTVKYLLIGGLLAAFLATAFA
jgi:beta-hydroxylase